MSPFHVSFAEIGQNEVMSSWRPKARRAWFSTWSLPISFLRWALINVDAVTRPIFRRTSPGLRLFSLSLHVSVIRDLELGLPAYENVRITNWSISLHNRLVRRLFVPPDPVAHVNARTWKQLTDRRIKQFTRRYKRYLSTFDGFVVTYPFCFVELFEEFQKPILAVVATRYEIPYSGDPARWARLDAALSATSLPRGSRIYANSKGEAAYIAKISGADVPVAPTVGDYLGLGILSGNHNQMRVILSRSTLLTRAIRVTTQGRWLPVSAAYGSPYRAEDLHKSEAVFVVPYNTNTMQLFELAASGTLVVVPGRRLLKSWAEMFAGEVFNEMSLLQLSGLNCGHLSEGDPNNYLSPGFLDWWLDHCDYYDPDVMPNVLTVDDLSEIDHAVSSVDRERLFAETADRNRRLSRVRDQVWKEFIRSCSNQRHWATKPN